MISIKKQTISTSLILITVILMDLLAGMEFDLFVPSFPELQSHFHLTSFWVEALLSINFIGYCIGLFFVGGLSDRYGRKPVIITGVLIFIMGSLFCLYGGSYPFLLMGRFLQGLGIAAPAILNYLIIADSYPIKKQQHLFALLNGVMNIAVGIAPVVGSYLTLYFHWQGNFMALLLLALPVLLMTSFFVPSFKKPDIQQSLSLQSYLPIFQSKPLMLLITYLIVICVPYWVFVGLSPLLYMKDLGVSLAHFGYYQGLLAFVFGIGSLLFGCIIHKVTPKSWLTLAICIFMVGLIGTMIVTIHNSHYPLLITLAFLPFIIGQITPGNILSPIALNFMPDAKGRISAVMRGGLLIVNAIAIQIASLTYHGGFQNIGVIMSVFIMLGIITLFFIIRNREIWKEA